MHVLHRDRYNVELFLRSLRRAARLESRSKKEDFESVGIVHSCRQHRGGGMELYSSPARSVPRQRHQRFARRLNQVFPGGG